VAATTTGDGPSGGPAAVFERERPYLLSVAYRLTSSWADAEDAVARAWPGWAAAAAGDGDPIEVPRAWLTRVVSRQALNHLRSAAVRRERYVGPWLPEPLVTAASPAAAGAAAPATPPDPLDVVVRDESVRLAFLVVLDTLTPEQRVAFVLHDVLELPFREVAAVLGCEEAAARQHASRARRRVHEADPAPRVPQGEAAVLLDRLAAALATGDAATVAELLAPDVVIVADGGGVVNAARRVISGVDDVSRYVVGVTSGRFGDLSFTPVLVNGDFGWHVRQTPKRPQDGTESVLTVAVRDGRIAALYNVAAPDKLAPAGGLPAAHPPAGGDDPADRL
jgi:RNA polymerase sigma-70 factor (ECF subfamily)